MLLSHLKHEDRSKGRQDNQTDGKKLRGDEEHGYSYDFVNLKMSGL